MSRVLGIERTFSPAAPPPASRLRSKGHSRVGGCQRDVRRRGQDPTVSQEGVLDAPGGRGYVEDLADVDVDAVGLAQDLVHGVLAETARINVDIRKILD